MNIIGDPGQQRQSFMAKNMHGMERTRAQEGNAGKRGTNFMSGDLAP
jgi:hypothetical protein